MIKNRCYLLIKLRLFCLKKLKQFVSSSQVPPIHNTRQLAIRMSSSNDTLVNTIIADMDTLQLKYMTLEEEEAAAEARWAEELLVEKRTAIEKAQQALKWAEEDLAIANNTYHRIRHVPRQKRRGVNFKTEVTLDERLDISVRWNLLNSLLKVAGKEERKLEYLDRPWCLEK